jgi:RNA polymerase sigma factor (TIGR02999 family)
LKPAPEQVTEILAVVGSGDPQAAEKLLPLVYEELRKLAALVHEAWMRLTGDESARFEGRRHFFAAAAEAMRRILIDRARQKRSLKRGGGAERVNLDDLQMAVAADDETVLVVDEALQKLTKEDPESAEFIKLRFFAGLTNAEAAQALGIPERTARRNWSFARAWLYREIRQQSGV